MQTIILSSYSVDDLASQIDTKTEQGFTLYGDMQILQAQGEKPIFYFVMQK